MADGPEGCLLISPPLTFSARRKPMKLCECGCGKRTTKRFIHGHNGRSPEYPFHKDKPSKGIGKWKVHCRGKQYVFWSHIIFEHHFLNGNEIPKGMIVHHKNGNPNDDRPNNLEMIDANEHAKIHRSKLVILKKDKEMRLFSSGTEASRFLGMNLSAISCAIRQKSRVGGWNPSYLQEDSK